MIDPNNTHDEISSVGLSHPSTASLSRKPDQCGASACTPSSAACDQGNLLACGRGGLRSGAKPQRSHGVAQGGGLDTKGRESSNKSCAHDIDGCHLYESSRCRCHAVPGWAFPVVGTEAVVPTVRNEAEVCTSQRSCTNGLCRKVERGTGSPATILASPWNSSKSSTAILLLVPVGSEVHWMASSHGRGCSVEASTQRSGSGNTFACQTGDDRYDVRAGHMFRRLFSTWLDDKLLLNGNGGNLGVNVCHEGNAMAPGSYKAHSTCSESLVPNHTKLSCGLTQQ